jgi:hypothetical protein
MKKLIAAVLCGLFPVWVFAQTDSELTIANVVYQGRMPCELGAFVTVTADPSARGFFDVHTKREKFKMYPVVTSTGAIRLEDRQSGAVWLQVANKSMLMDQKQGKRLADACMSPEQAAVTAALVLKPVPNILDAPTLKATK